jgi:MFS family permease
MLMYHTYCWGSYFYLSWLHTYLQKGRGLTEGEMAVFSTLPFIAGACGNLFGGWLSDRLVRSHGVKLGRRIIGTAGLALSAAFMLGAAVTPDKWMAVVFLTLGYGAMDCMLPVSWAVCLDVGRKYAGTVSGTMNMAGQVGSFASSVAFGYLVTYFGGYNAPLFPMAALLLISALLFSRIDPTEQLAEHLAEQSAPVGA